MDPLYALRLALSVFICLGSAFADDVYTVWSSFLFVRTGDRTPVTLGSLPTTLTPLGSQQLYSVGQLFRERYIASLSLLSSGSNVSSDAPGGSASGISLAPLVGMSQHTLSDQQLYILALDEQWTVASAQAFLQGLYPPYELNLTLESDNDIGGNVLDGLGVLGNGTYVEAPLSGYQYSRVRAASTTDYHSIFTAGNLACPSLDAMESSYTATSDYESLMAESASLYQSIGSMFLQGVLEQSEWNFDNAYDIYEYVSWLYTHNTTIYNDFYYDGTGDMSDAMTRLRILADAQQSAFFSNVTISLPYVENYTASEFGSISTIAGSALAQKILDQLSETLYTQARFWKLNILFGDFAPFLSFFALAGLPKWNTNFYGLPAYGSVMALELFSYTNTSNASSADLGMPDPRELWVRFLFRNGTDDSTFSSAKSQLNGLQSYPLFGRGPSQTDMPFMDFVVAMENIATGSPGDWCSACVSDALFCAAWNTSDALVSDPSAGESNNSAGHSAHHYVVAGVVGAIIGIVLAGMLLGTTCLVGGLRLHRVSISPAAGGIARRGSRGGFKGNKKLASDTDLALPKGRAIVDTSVERKASDARSSVDAAAGAKERVGSWELSDTGIKRLGLDGGRGFGQSVESLDVQNAKPVRPEDQV